MLTVSTKIFDTDASLHFLDKNGNEIDQSRLNVNHETVKVSLTISHIKTVAVQVQTTGSLPQGLYLESVSVDPDTIEITERQMCLMRSRRSRSVAVHWICPNSHRV